MAQEFSEYVGVSELLVKREQKMLIYLFVVYFMILFSNYNHIASKNRVISE
jgi:hypothetical protein